MKLHRISLLVLAFGLTSLSSTAFAQSYAFETLNHPDGVDTLLEDINNNGVILGAFAKSEDDYIDTPFVFEGDDFRILEFPGIPEPEVYAINDAGAMTGLGFDEDDFSFIAFQTDSEGNVETFSLPEAIGLFPDSIDEAGIVTGSTFTFDVDGIFRKDGDSIDEIILEEFGLIASANANDNGTIAGTGFLEDDTAVSFIYRDGVAEGFAAHPDGETFLTAINNSDVIAGEIFVDDDASRSFVFSENAFTEIAFPGAESTNVSGINDAGVVVGYYTLPDSDSYHGFIGRPVPEPENLSTFAFLTFFTVLGRFRVRR